MKLPYRSVVSSFCDSDLMLQSEVRNRKYFHPPFSRANGEIPSLTRSVLQRIRFSSKLGLLFNTNMIRSVKKKNRRIHLAM